jgi:hypothetical protein
LVIGMVWSIRLQSYLYSHMFCSRLDKAFKAEVVFTPSFFPDCIVLQSEKKIFERCGTNSN